LEWNEFKRIITWDCVDHVVIVDFTNSQIFQQQIKISTLPTKKPPNAKFFNEIIEIIFEYLSFFQDTFTNAMPLNFLLEIGGFRSRFLTVILTSKVPLYWSLFVPFFH
jgi:hypothetical protein